ncbi:5-carboxymethyl-2-hydroxymuconate isomerase [Pseudomonas sp. JUb42]|jgi:5-carboxymethyl-2-hydroxymuconate isomerase|uniref:5-carboxymethyl-2-hydroxymuconate Delta-isomerase n=1 Tax=Pseudomonas sp. JUb42 TaxID=2940611 RepID=UPI0021676D57|nr:5-carboxymethyl-2-hydroxymuconate Delta-isomerase [Pseudomonas sp. JUb42]MCS3468484.1 5-carboxymethyl-2-hydroxymuconate isomerase [Pseudomonas sp. JUb42]
MPHMTLEYTPNLPSFDVRRTLLALNQALFASGQFTSEADIQSKAVAVGEFQVGTLSTPRGFMHVQMALFNGRSAEVKRQLSASLLAVLQGVCEWPSDLEVQLSVDIVDLDRDAYAWTTLKP